MSKNKYKNNEPLNQKNTELNDTDLSGRDPLNETHFGPDEAVRRVETEEEPILLSEWEDPVTEMPLPPLEYPEINLIPDYREHVTLTKPVAIDFIEDKPIPAEKKHYTEEDFPRTGAPPEGRHGRQTINDDAPESVDSKYYSKPIDPYVGEKIFPEEDYAQIGERTDLDPSKRPIIEDVPESVDNLYYSEPINAYTGDKIFPKDSFDPMDEPGYTGPTPLQRQMGRVSYTKRKGFPWWWILLPLILLALIYGLSRPATTPGTTSPNTTSPKTTSYLPRVETRVGNIPLPGEAYFIGL